MVLYVGKILPLIWIWSENMKAHELAQKLLLADPEADVVVFADGFDDENELGILTVDLNGAKHVILYTE